MVIQRSKLSVLGFPPPGGVYGVFLFFGFFVVFFFGLFCFFVFFCFGLVFWFLKHNAVKNCPNFCFAGDWFKTDFMYPNASTN